MGTRYRLWFVNPIEGAIPATGGEIKRPTKMVIERWGKADERGRETTEIDRKRVIPQVDYKKIVLEIAV